MLRIWVGCSQRTSTQISIQTSCKYASPVKCAVDANNVSAMSRDGTLIAYSTPTNIRQVKDQAALATMALQDSFKGPEKVSGPGRGETAASSVLDTGKELVIEADECNLIAHQIDDDLYVVLLGKCAPRDEERLQASFEDSNSSFENLVDSSMTHDALATAKVETFAEEVLKMHKAKASSLADYIRLQVG